MIKELHLQHVGPAPRFDIAFARRLNLLTGDNGLGKTFLLDVAWWALTGTWAGDPAWPARRESARISYRMANSTHADLLTSHFGEAMGNYPEHLRTRKQIHAELLRLLPGHDPFWPRWIVTTQVGAA
jgi:DNA repair exonuclease SbcCD ATPase subunit